MLTVKELIEKLSALPQDLPVVRNDFEIGPVLVKNVQAVKELSVTIGPYFASEIMDEVVLL